MSDNKTAVRTAAAVKAWNTRKGTDGHKNKVRTPHFPLYSTVRKMLGILPGVSRATLKSMMRIIDEQTGTPQNPVDWSDPDTWISERLSGAEADLARRIWVETGRSVNPRHIYGAYFFINRYGLLVPDDADVYQLSERGRAFLGDDITVVRELDEAEGLPQLLGILATKTRARRGDLLAEWGEFLLEHSQLTTPATFRATLRNRLLNLIEREFVTRDGNAYVITSRGMAYATSTARLVDDPKREVLRAITEFNNNQREALREKLKVMHPYRFEHLVRDLLEAMGYEDVVVTKESGDKGVDVVATVQFGITTITEVVQVKRHQANIPRATLDQLRGALPYHKAIRGTLITVGGFSKGCTEAALYPGAAPIGLIDGEKLLNLLIEHKIGVKKRDIALYEVDADFFQPQNGGDPEAELADAEVTDAVEEV
jgi:restriction system protein